MFQNSGTTDARVSFNPFCSNNQADFYRAIDDFCGKFKDGLEKAWPYICMMSCGAGYVYFLCYGLYLSGLSDYFTWVKGLFSISSICFLLPALFLFASLEALYYVKFYEENTQWGLCNANSIVLKKQRIKKAIHLIRDVLTMALIASWMVYVLCNIESLSQLSQGVDFFNKPPMMFFFSMGFFLFLLIVSSLVDCLVCLKGPLGIWTNPNIKKDIKNQYDTPIYTEDALNVMESYKR